VTDLSQLPRILVERLQHYFATYKLVQDAPEAQIKVQQVYGADYAARVIDAALQDYLTLVSSSG
jgi:inorganic pyrophosphatase